MLGDPTDSVTVRGFFTSSQTARIEQITASGHVLSLGHIDALTSAMAASTQPAAGRITAANLLGQWTTST